MSLCLCEGKGEKRKKVLIQTDQLMRERPVDDERGQLAIALDFDIQVPLLTDSVICPCFEHC